LNVLSASCALDTCSSFSRLVFDHLVGALRVAGVALHEHASGGLEDGGAIRQATKRRHDVERVLLLLVLVPRPTFFGYGHPHRLKAVLHSQLASIANWPRPNRFN
jgi:hypothetical protein